MATLEDKINSLCRTLKVPQPLEFMTRVMAGHDPRRLSSIYEMVLAFEEEYGEGKAPDDWDYQELVDKIKERYTYGPVQLQESHNAAKQILEYTHSKKKQIEHSGTISEAPAIADLTQREIRAFKKKFNEFY